MVLVTGCLPQAEQAGFFARFPFVDGALGPQNLHRLPELLHAAVEPAGAGPAGFFEDGPRFSGSLTARRERPFQAWVQVMSGCTNFCSYCIVPYVRGPERSRPGRRPRGRGRDAGRRRRSRSHPARPERQRLRTRPRARGRGRRRRTSPACCGDWTRSTAWKRVRFMTSHPKDLGDDLIAAVAGLRTVCEHVHLPAQAGSDRVLRGMRRGYTAEQYLERVRALRAAVPDVNITTDLIAGFPGETEARLRRHPRTGAGGGVRRGVHVRVLAAGGHGGGRPAGPGAARRPARARGAPDRAHAAAGAGFARGVGRAAAPRCSWRAPAATACSTAAARARTSPSTSLEPWSPVL